ncbi:ribonuclease H-like domain-containing protein [Tanacetum coccineum]
MARSNDENPPPPPQTPPQQAPHTVSTIKLPILKKGEYDIWAMKMEHYLSHIDYPIWEVIQKGNGPVSVSTDTNGVMQGYLPSNTTTAKEILARERKARTTLLMALPEDHLAKFHKMTDAKEMWDTIKSRFGGNDELKKMQKYILKQQFEGFFVSNSEGLHKGYDRFQSLLSQLEIHGAGVSTEDANQKFLSTSSTNDVSTAYGVSTSSGYNSQRENSSSYIDELMYSFFANKSSGLQLDHEDLEQLDEFDFRREPVGFDKTKVEFFNCHKTGHFARECRSKGNQESRRRDAGNTGLNKDNGVDWTGHVEDEQENFALIAYSNSGSDTKDRNSSLYSSFKKGMHAVPPPMTGNYMPPGPDREVDDSISHMVQNDSKLVNLILKPVILTLEYELTRDDNIEIQPSKEQEKPSFAFVNTIKHVKTPRETVKEQNIYSLSPKADKRDWNGLMSKRWVWDMGLLKRHVLYVTVLVILLEIMIFMRKEWLNRLKYLTIIITQQLNPPSLSQVQLFLI